METIIAIGLLTLGIYFLIGLFFGIYFILWGMDKIDPDAHGASWQTRLILLPGSIAFWVILLKKILNPSKRDD
jgi:hypothetical protein